MRKLLSLLFVPIFTALFLFTLSSPVFAACNISFPSAVGLGGTVEIQINGELGHLYSARILDPETREQLATGGGIGETDGRATVIIQAPSNEGSYIIEVTDSTGDACTGESTIQVDSSSSTVANPNAPAELGAIVKVIENIIKLLVPAAAVAFFIMFLVGGVQFLMSGGDPKAAGAARNTLTYAIIGIILVVVSWLILLVIKNVTGVDVTTVGFPTL